MYYTVLRINLFKGLMRMDHSYMHLVAAPPPWKHHSDGVIHSRGGCRKNTFLRKEGVS